VRPNESCDGTEPGGEMPTGQDFVWVHSIKNFPKEIKNYLRVPFHNKLVVSLS
jgi:hypothetical protein